MSLAENLVIHKYDVFASLDLENARALKDVRASGLDVSNAHALHPHVLHCLRMLLARHFHELLHQLNAKRGAAALQRDLQNDLSDADPKVEQEHAGTRLGEG